MKRKIFIYRRGGIGDTLLLFPLFEILTKAGFEIYATGNREPLLLAKKAGLIKEAFSELFFQVFEKNSFFCVIFFTKKEAIPEKILSLIKKPSTFFIPPFPTPSELSQTFKKFPLYEYYLKQIKTLFLEKFRINLPSSFSLKLPLFKKELKNFSLKKKQAIIHPGSGSPKKNPPLSLFKKIESFLKTNDFEVNYILGPAEEKIFKTYPELPWIQTKSLLELGKLLKKSTIFIGNDSGISHLASYLEIPSFIFYGPTDPVMWKPIGLKTKILTLNLPCSPCFPNICKDKPCLNEEKLFNLFIKAFQSWKHSFIQPQVL